MHHLPTRRRHWDCPACLPATTVAASASSVHIPLLCPQGQEGGPGKAPPAPRHSLEWEARLGGLLSLMTDFTRNIVQGFLCFSIDLESGRLEPLDPHVCTAVKGVGSLVGTVHGGLGREAAQGQPTCPRDPFAGPCPTAAAAFPASVLDPVCPCS